MTTFRPCAVVPTFDNPTTVGAVVAAIRVHVPEVIVVDDGSGPVARAVLDALAAEGTVRVVRRASRGGKGAAVKDGLRAAQALGCTHAVQLDADGQHDADDIPRFLAVARRAPEALVLGRPVFDEAAPRVRLAGRRFNMLWTNLELGPGVVLDSLCGFRVYPVAATLAAGARGDAMDFDPEIPVRMARVGVPIVNVPTRVRYFAPRDGHVSHFRMVRDNALIVRMHTGIILGMIARALRPPPSARP